MRAVAAVAIVASAWFCYTTILNFRLDYWNRLAAHVGSQSFILSDNHFGTMHLENDAKGLELVVNYQVYSTNSGGLDPQNCREQYTINHGQVVTADRSAACPLGGLSPEERAWEIAQKVQDHMTF